ncbi:hypothetical protein FSP39_025442 [Pinctada imbricata]|uniref:Serine protease n=1 Tax=Pinctada imbricata TaxID=66713 RepID=A0AA88XPP9_PINIB|nr:hypothetical protein FSP39_025442 [Pinctada imbricata]
MHEHKESNRCNFGVESKLADELFEKHSNLNAIRPSRIRSMGFGTPNHRIIQQSCIVLYCSRKGYIPINEESFPVEINGIRTDVREGYFMFGADELRQGDSIFRKSKVGTLGGFVEFSDRTLGFLTCAHVLFDVNELYKLRSDCRADDIELLVFKERNRNIGSIVEARFTSDKENEISIDAAVIKIPEINERFVDLSYPDIHDLKGMYTSYTLKKK